MTAIMSNKFIGLDLRKLAAELLIQIIYAYNDEDEQHEVRSWLTKRKLILMAIQIVEKVPINATLHSLLHYISARRGIDKLFVHYSEAKVSIYVVHESIFLVNQCSDL